MLPVTDTTSSVVLLIGMAVGVDYSLFYVRRAREERARGRTALDAVEIAAATSGRAVVISGGTVAVAMAGMFLSGSTIFSSLAWAASAWPRPCSSTRRWSGRCCCRRR